MVVAAAGELSTQPLQSTNAATAHATAASVRADVRALAGSVASRLAKRWGGVLDSELPPAALVRDFDEECARAGLSGLLFGAVEEAGANREDLATAAIYGIAEVDGGLAALFLSRLAALLPWSEDCVAEEPVVDGWSATMPSRAQGDSIWAWGWCEGLPLAVCTREGEAWRLELLAAEGVELIEVHRRLGLRSCPSAWVRLHPGQRVAMVKVAEEAMRHCRSLIAGWWGIIALTRARAALVEAWKYASVRYQGGALLAQHRLVQEMLGRALDGVVAAETLLDRGFGGDRSSLAAGVRLAARESERAAHTAQQIFGGYGYMRDYPVERCLRDTKSAAVAAGLFTGLWGHAANLAATLEGRGWPIASHVFAPAKLVMR